MLYPSAIIYINNDLSDAVKSRIQQQLFIHQTYDVNTFDALLLADPTYINEIRANNKRILVVADFSMNLINKNLADMSLTFSRGLLYVLDNKVGPPGVALQAAKISIDKLFYQIDNG